MSKIVWGSNNSYEYGISKCIVGVSGEVHPWNGVKKIVEKPRLNISDPLYVDGINVFREVPPEDVYLEIDAYTYPEAIELGLGFYELADGVTISGLYESRFDLCYRTEESISDYNLHFFYDLNGIQKPNNRKTIADDPDPSIFSFVLEGLPKKLRGYHPTMKLTISSSDINPYALSDLEDLLYGTGDTDPYFPPFHDLVEMIKNHLTLRVELDGDIWTASSKFPGIVEELPNEMFKIDYGTVTIHPDGSFTMKSG